MVLEFGTNAVKDFQNLDFFGGGIAINVGTNDSDTSRHVDGNNSHAVSTVDLECTEQMEINFSDGSKENEFQNDNIDLRDAPRNIKRRRILPPMFLAPPLTSVPEDSSSDTESFIEDRGSLYQMRIAAHYVCRDLEDRTAERMREERDYFEGDTPHTSQESGLSDYNWSTREGGDMVPLDKITQFVFKYLTRPRIFSRVSPYARLTDEIFERDPDQVKATVANILNCEPVVLLNMLEDAIGVAENIIQSGDEDDSDY